MAFNKLYLDLLSSGAKNGLTPALWSYYNKAGDNVFASGYFADDSINLGDQILIQDAGYKNPIILSVTAVSSGAGTVGASIATATGNTSTGTAIGLTTKNVKLVSVGGANAFTLADGYEGQVLTITMITDGGDATVTPAHPLGYATLKFTAVGQTVNLLFTNAGWYITANNQATLA
jgi:hypothetical protein